MGRFFILTGLAFGLAASGCAKAPIPTDSPTTTIRAAEEAGATDNPTAALYVQLAKEEVEQAKKLSADGEKDDAQSVLLRAEADAELAVILAKAQSEKAEAQEAVDRVHALQSGDMGVAERTTP